MIKHLMNSNFQIIELAIIAEVVEILLDDHNLYVDVQSSLDVEIKIGKN